MTVNYDDKRFQNVENQEKQALTSANNMYNNMINNTDNYYNEMSVAAENYGKQQAEIQQANTDFAIEKIEQQKDLAAKDYTREQKGAYVDWQKQSNQYGVNAEQLASSGLRNTGYSESSQVSMYNTYQNRVSQARDTYNRAVLDYDNGIKEAQLTNNAALAEIAYQSLQTKLKLGLDQFQYKNELLNQQLQMQRSISNEYYNRYQDVLKQINTENALAEEKRQFDKQYSLSKSSLRSSGGGGSKSGNNSISITPNQPNNNTSSGLKDVVAAGVKAAKTISNSPSKTVASFSPWLGDRVQNGNKKSSLNSQRMLNIYATAGGLLETDKSKKTVIDYLASQNLTDEELMFVINKLGI